MVPIMDKFYRNRCIINLCQTGQLTQEEIAQSVELSQGRISQLYHQFQREGESGLVVKRAPGAASKLTPEPRAQLPGLFSKGAEHYGFEGAIWTSARVGEVIQPHLGVTYEVSSMGLMSFRTGFYTPKTETT
jgi:transposase